MLAQGRREFSGVSHLGFAHDDGVLLVRPTLSFVEQGVESADVLLAPPGNWTDVGSRAFSGNPAWGHWLHWEGRCAGMHTCMHTYPYLHTYTHTYIHTCMHPSIQASKQTYMHACMHTYRYAALLYLEDPGALPFVYLLRRWGFAYSDHFVVALASPRISDIVAQLTLASQSRVFLELAVRSFSPLWRHI